MVLWALVWSAFNPCALAEEVSPHEALVLATYNVRNYLEQNRWHAGQYRFAHPKPEAEKRKIREVIHAANADVLFLQEMGSGAHLEELRRDLEAEGLRYPYSHFAASEEGRSGLAVLAKRPPEQALLVEPIDPGQQLQMRRGMHEVVIPFAGGRLRVLHVHLKSRYTVDADDPEAVDERATEIAFLAESARTRSGLYPGDWILLAGDFNTPFEDSLMEPLRGFGTPVEAGDLNGARWTYHHVKRDSRERIDGFWTGSGSPSGATFKGIGIYPVQHGAEGSDHRLVAIRVTVTRS